MNPLLGVGYKIGATLAFTIMSAAIKWLGAKYPTGQIVFFRSAFALVPLLAWLAWNGRLGTELRTRNLFGHLVRGLAGSCAMFATFVGLIYLPLSDAVVIGYAAPLATVALAALLLGERVRAYRWSAVAAGFGGVVIMLLPELAIDRPGGAGGGYLIGAAFALGGALAVALAMVQVRRMSATETTGAIVFYFTLLTTILGGATIALGWTAPGPFDLAILVGIGVVGGVGQILQTLSYRHADASVIAPFDYVSMIWAVGLGWLLFGDLPDAAVVAGGAVIAASGVFVIWREGRLGLARRQALATAPQRPV